MLGEEKNDELEKIDFSLSLEMENVVVTAALFIAINESKVGRPFCGIN